MNYFSSKNRNKKDASKRNGLKTNGGFLLVELLVALFIFSLVMVISIGSIIALLDANRKTQGLKSVMNNLNLALDSMTKALAVGKDYDCGVLGAPKDCLFPVGSGDSQITFLSNEDLDDSGDLDRITYSLENDASGGYIERFIEGGPQAIRMTAPEINIEKLKFFVSGTAPFSGGADTNQPQVMIWIEGKTRPMPRGTETSFHIQTIVSQRVADNL